jgi:nicotinamide/nicotinate riboside kinase
MEKSLSHIHATGTFPVSSAACFLSQRSEHGHIAPLCNCSLPADQALTKTLISQPDLDSKEDKNSVGKCPVPDAKIAEVKARVQSWLEPGQPGDLIFNKKGLKVCLLDGFLLYCESMASVMKMIDVKLFLLVSRAKATQRREARDGYVTLEGFWKDPPGYVDKIVWPNYSEAHSRLFKDGNVEGTLRAEVLEKAGIRAQLDQGLDVEFGVTLEWAVDTIIRELERIVLAQSGVGEMTRSE